MARAGVGGAASAVYLPFKTFLTAIEVLNQGIPPTIDKSVFNSSSGAAQAQIIAALKTLRLISPDGTPQSALHEFAAANQQERRRLLGELLTEHYPELVRLGANNGSVRQLQDAMRERGVERDTLRKAISFYLQAADHAGLQMSPLWRRVKQGDSAGKSRRRGPSRWAPLRPALAADQESTEGRNLHQLPSTSIQLELMPSGGIVRLTVSADLIALSAEERAFVFDIIDRFKGYAAQQAAERVQPAEEPPAEARSEHEE